MSNKKNYYREISVYEMFSNVLSKWKVILIVTLVGCIVGGLYSVYLSNRDISEDVSIEQLKALMTSEEEKDVTDAAEIIKNYRIKYKSQKEYNENSIFQNLNPNAIHCMTLEYYIDNDYVVTYPAISSNNNLVPILQSYVSSLGESQIYVKMQNEINSDIQPSYYAEVVNVDTDFQENGVFTIEIYGYDDSMIEKMSAIIEAYLASEHDDVSEVYSDHDLVLASKNASIKVDNEVYEQQQFNIAYLTDITTAISKLESTFSGNQLIYLKKLVHEEMIEEVSIPKYVVVFGMAFFVVITIMYALQYVLSPKLKSVSEFEKLSGIITLGVINNNTLVKAKDKTKSQDSVKASNEETINIIATKINLVAEKEKLENICILTMCDNYSEDSEIIKSINSKISSDIDMQLIKKVIYDHSAIENACKIRNAILLEEIDNSRYSELVKEFDFCEEYDFNILGSILVK